MNSSRELLKNNIWKMYVVKFLNNLIFFGAVTVPFFTEWGHLNFTQLFILQSWFIAWSFIMEIPTGMIADKHGRKFSIVIAGLFLGSAGIVYTRMPNFYVFLIAEFIWAVGSAFMSGADKAIVYDTLKQIGKSKVAKKVFSYLQMADAIGIILGLTVGSFIAGLQLLPYPDNLALPMLMTAFSMFGCGIVAITLHEPRRTLPKQKYLQLAKESLLYIFKHRKLRALIANMILMSVMTFFIFWLYQPLLGKAGVGISFYGIVGAAANIVGVILLWKLVPIERFFGPKITLMLTALIPGAFYIALGLNQSVLIVVLGTIVVIGIKIFRIPLFDHYMNVHIKSRDRATVLSSISMIEKFIMIPLYPIIGFLTDISLENTLILLGVLTLVFAFATRLGKSDLHN